MQAGGIFIKRCMMDYGEVVPYKMMEDPVESSEALLKKCHNRGGGRLQYVFAPRFVVSCSEKLLKGVKDIAKEYEVMIHTHASENQSEIEVVQRDKGMRNMRYLHKLGLMGTKVSYCPNCNMKLASGIA